MKIFWIVTIILTLGAVKCFVFIFIITSDSMVPTFFAGDTVIALKMSSYNEGDVIVFKLKNNRKLTHRVIAHTKNCSYVTKGDANRDIDRSCVNKEQIIAKVFIIFPTSHIFGNPPFSNKNLSTSR